MCGSHPLSIPSGKLGSIPNQRKSWPWQRPLDRLPPARVEPAHTGAEHPTQAKMRRMRACNAQWTLSSCPCRTPALLRLACLLEFRLRLKEFTCLGEKIQRDSTVAWLLHVASHVTSYLGKLRPTKVSCQFMSVSSWKHPRPALMAPWLARDILITTRFAQEDDCTIAADPPFFCRVLGTGEKLPGYHPG